MMQVKPHPQFRWASRKIRTRKWPVLINSSRNPLLRWGVISFVESHVVHPDVSDHKTDVECKGRKYECKKQCETHYCKLY